LRLRWKTLIIIATTFISILVISLVTLQALTLNSVASIERGESFRETERVLDLLSHELSDQNATTIDYAAWNDTYEFVQDGNVNYITENMIDETFANLRLNIMLFLNSSDQVIFGKAFDLQNMTETPFPQSLLQHLANNHLLLHHGNATNAVAGIILLPEGPVLVASSPILTSLYQGPVMGTLITGRFLDSFSISRLYESVHLPIVLQILGNPWVSSDFQVANSSMSKDKPLFSQPLDKENVAGYALIDDVYGNPVVIMKITMPRDIYAQGLTSIAYSVAALFVLGSVFCVVSIILLEKFVLSRLSQLNVDVRNVEKEGNFAMRVSVAGKDELSALSGDINSMLSRLEQTTRRLGTLLETAKEGIVAVDPSENITFANKAFADMAGYGQNELVGMNVLRLLDEEGIRKVAEETGIRKKGRTSRYDLVFHRKNGEPRTAQLSSSPLWNEDGSYAGALSIIMDVTEQKHLEQAFLESNTRLQQITDNMSDMVSLIDAAGVYKYVSPSVRKTLGYEPKNMLSKTIFDFLHPDDLGKVKEEIQKKSQTPGPSRIEYRYRHADGHYLWLEGACNLVLDDQGKIVGAVLSSHDVTERRIMEEELHKSEERFRGIAERSFDAIATVDLEGTIMYASPSVGKVLGYPDTEVTGKSFLEYFTPVQLSNATQLFADLMQGRKLEGLQMELQRRDGTAATVEINASPIIVNGEVAGIQAVFRDITQRKRTEDALRESEEKLRRTLESSPDAIILTDLAGNVIDCNQATLDLYGFSTKEEILGKAGFKYISEKDYEKAMEHMSIILKKGAVRNIEYTLNTKDGKEILVDASASIIRDASGQPKYLVGITRDITQRKKMEDALKESEEKFRAISGAAYDAIILADDEGKIIYWNPAAEGIFGYSGKEAFGNEVSRFIIPERFREAYQKGIEVSKKTGAGPFFDKTKEMTSIRKDGTEFPMELSMTAFQLKGRWHVLGLVKDITERKQMEGRIKESEERLRQLIEYAPDAIYVNDLNGDFVEGNRQAEEMTGYTKEEIIGKNMLEIGLLSEEYLPKAAEALEKNLRGEKTGPDEFELTKKDGSKVTVEISTFPVKRAGNVEILGIARDITERKQMQRKLEEYSQQLEQMVEKRTEQLKETQEQLVKAERLATIGQVAAMVGHDLRNPLTGIKGAAYYLKTRPTSKTDRKAMEMLELIEKDIEYSNKIITDLLEYSREIRLQPTETTPKSIIEETLSLLEIPNIIQVSNETQSEPRILVDIEKMNRVFVNLIKNAFDAMSNGGKLVIRSTRTNGNVEFAFTDTGVGIPKEQMEKVWTPFFTTKAKGMGLGLPICKRIVEAHKGQIFVESVVDVGTTFTVIVPVEPKVAKKGGEKVWVNVPESLSLTTMKA